MARQEVSLSATAAEKPCFRTFYGATVYFREDVRVSYVKLASDSLTVRFSNLPVDTTCESLLEVLQPFEFQTSGVNILIHDRNESCSSAEVQLDDCYMAELLSQSLDKTHLKNHEISVQLCRNVDLLEQPPSGLQIDCMVCSWHLPRRVAWANYIDQTQAEEAALSMNGISRHGRNLRCSIRPPRSYGRGPRLYPVQIQGLSPETTKQDLANDFIWTKEVVMGSLSYELSKSDAGAEVQRLLIREGELSLFHIHDSDHPRYTKATASYRNLMHARNALRNLHDIEIPGLGGARLYLNQRVAVEFVIASELYTRIRADVELLSHHGSATNYVRSTITKLTEPFEAFRLRIEGPDAQSVVKMRSATEQILAGRVAMDGDQPIWHDFFLHSAGKLYLEDLWEGRGVYIKADPRKHELRIYGSAFGKEKIDRTLMKKCEELGKTGSDVGDGQATDWIWGGLQDGVLIASTTLGNAFSRLNLTGNRIKKPLISSGDQTTALLSGTSSIAASSPKNNQKQCCAVCWTEPDEPYLTSCGHVYCLGCLKDQCALTSDSVAFPLQCLGDQGHCSHVFGIAELEQALPSAAFESLLKLSFDSFVRKVPDKMQFCPTADCPRIYRVSVEAADSTCSACHLSICTCCGAPSHEGLTCSEHKEWSAAGILDYQKWMQDNRFKACPKCQIAIEKSEGCNHITCSGCGVNFCWICLGVFERDQIYDHMNEAHGNIGLEGENGDGYGGDGIGVE